MRGFINFIRKQGVIGLAVGFILGGAVSKLVSAIVTDLINPVIGLALNKVSGLENAYFQIEGAKIMWGDFVSVLIDFLVVALVVYFGVKALKIDNFDHKG